MLRIGTILHGTYRIDRYLSSGGFGNTYVVTHVGFDEAYAIKEFFMKGVTQRDSNSTTVSVSNSVNQESFLQQKEKFKKEARRIRQLHNSHIVGVHDLFEENGTAYYVMDYVDGENLSERLRRTDRPMTESEVHLILPQILDALKAVHDAGMWHLDLKPANIMVDKTGNVKLIDFGASKQFNAQKGGATTSTAVSYTNGYAPREQMEQNYDKFGPWTDIYALGATLYNLLTNKRPPLPTDIDDDITVDKHEALPFPNGISDDMKTCVLQMMKTNRLQRPQSITAIMDTETFWKEETKQSLKQQYTSKSKAPVTPEPPIQPEATIVTPAALEPPAVPKPEPPQPAKPAASAAPRPAQPYVQPKKSPIILIIGLLLVLLLLGGIGDVVYYFFLRDKGTDIEQVDNNNDGIDNTDKIIDENNDNKVGNGNIEDSNKSSDTAKKQKDNKKSNNKIKPNPKNSNIDNENKRLNDNVRENENHNKKEVEQQKQETPSQSPSLKRGWHVEPAI